MLSSFELAPAFFFAVIGLMVVDCDMEAFRLRTPTSRSRPLQLSIIRSSSRATRKPDSDVSAMRARHTLVQSSIIVRMQNLRPSVS